MIRPCLLKAATARIGWESARPRKHQASATKGVLLCPPPTATARAVHPSTARAACRSALVRCTCEGPFFREQRRMPPQRTKQHRTAAPERAVTSLTPSASHRSRESPHRHTLCLGHHASVVTSREPRAGARHNDALPPSAVGLQTKRRQQSDCCPYHLRPDFMDANLFQAQHTCSQTLTVPPTANRHTQRRSKPATPCSVQPPTFAEPSNEDNVHFAIRSKTTTTILT